MPNIIKEERKTRLQDSLELLRLMLSERTLSVPMIEKISQFLHLTAQIGGEQHHRQVLKVLDIVKTSKTEEEINGKLEKIME